MGRPHRHVGLQLLESKALSWGIIRRSACILAEITIRKSQLPEYSPELSLIEILWRFMKYEWIEFWAYTDFASLIQYVEGVIKGFGDQYKINFE